MCFTINAGMNAALALIPSEDLLWEDGKLYIAYDDVEGVGGWQRVCC